MIKVKHSKRYVPSHLNIQCWHFIRLLIGRKFQLTKCRNWWTKLVAFGRIKAGTKQSSFYPNCTSEWDKLNPKIRLAPSVAVFNTKLLSIIWPPAKPIFGIHDPIGLSYPSLIRVGLSRLNFNKFKHNVWDTVNPRCPTNDFIEDSEHLFHALPFLWLSMATSTRSIIGTITTLS